MRFNSYLLISLLLLSISGCKSIQKIAQIPSGGEIVAEKEKPKKNVYYTVALSPTITEEIAPEQPTETSPKVEPVADPEPIVETEPAVESVPVQEEPVVVEETRSEKFEVVVGETTPANQYFVVVGSFKSETNAQNLQKQLLGKNNQAAIVRNELGMFRVIIASFPTYSEAKIRRDLARKEFADAWILVRL